MKQSFSKQGLMLVYPGFQNEAKIYQCNRIVEEFQTLGIQIDKIKVDEQNKKTFTLPNGEEKIVCADYTRDKEIMVSLALQLTLQYQLLEKIFEYEKEMHLVREL